MQTNVNNNKTEIEIIQSQIKSKTSLHYYVHVMRDKLQKCKASNIHKQMERKIASRHISKENVTSVGLQVAL